MKITMAHGGGGEETARLIADVFMPHFRNAWNEPMSWPNWPKTGCDPVSFADLGLVVIDEQHRFGVEQRAALAAKALQLTGGPTSPPPPADRNVYGVLVASGQAVISMPASMGDRPRASSSRNGRAR